MGSIHSLIGLAVTVILFSASRVEGQVSHARWDKILKTYVTENGWVNYLRLNREGRGELSAYLRELARADPAKLGDKKDQMAFWINAYNAICVQKLLDNKIPESVPKAVVFGTNIFKERTYTVAGKKRSLDDIEHTILRPRYKDHRVHATVVCGASSCPRLRPEAYVGEKLDKQLDEECRSWINKERNRKGKRKNYLDRKAKIYYASKIFDWYEEDFGDSDAGILRFLRRFADDDDRKFLERNRVSLEFLSYDWTLNKQ